MTALSINWPQIEQPVRLLELMRKWYQKAAETSPDDNYLRDYEFLTRLCDNWSLGSNELPDLELEGDSFFAVLNGARRKLIRWIADGGDDAGFQIVEDALVASWTSGASPFEFKAVLELLEFLIVMRRRAHDDTDGLLDSLRRLKLTALGAVGWET